MAGTIPGSVVFEPEEIEILNDARLILLTGWTEAQIDAASPTMLAAVLAVASADDEIRSYQIKKSVRKT